MGGIQNAREEEWWGLGQYNEGIMVNYKLAEKDLVRIWGFRYNKKETIG
ncbi:MAG: hypothetical protein ACMUJM_02140 [bacterium]